MASYRTVWRVSFLIGAVAGLITYGVMRMGIVYLITREHSSAKVEDANIFIIVSVLLVFCWVAMARGHWRRGIKEKHPEIYNPWFFGILYYFKDPETKLSRLFGKITQRTDFWRFANQGGKIFHNFFYRCANGLLPKAEHKGKR